MGEPLYHEQIFHPLNWIHLRLSRGAIVAALLFWVLVLALVLHRHYAMYPSYTSFDQGIFNQLFWNGTHGANFFQSSLSSTLSTPVVKDGQIPEVDYHRLGQHFTPALLLWHPLYWLLPSPATLLVLLVSLVAIAGIVLYQLARLYLDVPLATWVTTGYYAANAVIGPSLGNFHDFSQIPLYLFSLFWALEKRCWWLFGIMATLILLVREDSGVILFSVGFYLLVSRRFPRLGLAVCAASFGYVVLITTVIMPLFSEDISRRFMMEQFGHYVDGRQASTLQVMLGMLTSPWLVVQNLFTPLGGTIQYLLGQWLPFMFVPAIAPSAWALVAAPLVQTLLRKDPIALSINLRYAMTLVPGLCYGTILWWAAHPQAWRPRLRYVWMTCITLSLLFTITSNPNRALSWLIPDSIHPRVYLAPTQQWQHVGTIRRFMAQIPADASVSTTSHIVPHLSSRREIVRFPLLQVRTDTDEVIQAEYVLLDLAQPQQYQAVFRDERDRLTTMLRGVNPIVDQSYGVQGFADGVLFLQRDQPSNPEALRAWRQYRRSLRQELS
jgi:uncharacterized membrane protein